MAQVEKAGHTVDLFPLVAKLGTKNLSDCNMTMPAAKALHPRAPRSAHHLLYQRAACTGWAR